MDIEHYEQAYSVHVDDRQFLTYSPFQSFAGNSKYFVQANRRPTFEGCGIETDSIQDEIDPSAHALWRLGKKAFDAFGAFESENEFSTAIEENFKLLDLLREMLKDRLDSEPTALKFLDEHGEIYFPKIEHVSDWTILHGTWQSANRGQLETGYFGGICLAMCFVDIDNAIIGLHTGRIAVGSAMNAVEKYSCFEAITSKTETLQLLRSELGLKAAIERYKSDPKQAAKALILDCFNEWEKNGTRYKSHGRFATDMLTKIPVDHEGTPIISHDTITKKWIPAWRKSRK